MFCTNENNDIKFSHHLTQLLLALGFQIGNLGFSYLKRMILIMQGKSYTLTEVYTMISNECGKPIEAISSSVRNGIKVAYRHTNFRILENLLGVEMFTSSFTVPAPRELIALINEYFRIFWNGETGIKAA